MVLAKDKREVPVTMNTPDPRVVDLWVRHSLTQKHAAVLQEKLPEEWLAMVDAKTEK